MCTVALDVWMGWLGVQIVLAGRGVSGGWVELCERDWNGAGVLGVRLRLSVGSVANWSVLLLCCVLTASFVHGLITLLVYDGL